MFKSLEPIIVDGVTIWVETAVDSISPNEKAKFTKTSANAVLGDVASTVTNVDFAKFIPSIFAPAFQAFVELKPKEVVIEVSLGMKAEVGLFVASSEGSASIKISAKWALQ